jgi:hypothetical protein
MINIATAISVLALSASAVFLQPTIAARNGVVVAIRGVVSRFELEKKEARYKHTSELIGEFIGTIKMSLRSGRDTEMTRS